MSYQNGIINHLIRNTLEIFFTDNDPENDPDHVEATITEGNIVSESMKLKQSICDGDELRFGGCIASQFSIDLLKTSDRLFENDLSGRWITVKLTQTYADPDEIIYPSSTLYPSDDLYPGRVIGTHSEWIFSGYIDSAKVNKTDKNVINVIAYDVLAKFHETDATDWLFSAESEGATDHNCFIYTIMHRIAQELWKYGSGYAVEPGDVGIDYLFEEYFTGNGGSDKKVINAFIVYRTYWKDRKDKVSFGSLLNQICEAIGCFGRIIPTNSRGKFSMLNLSGTPEEYSFYEKLETEDYKSTGYTDFQFSVSGNDRPGKSTSGIYTKATDGTIAGGLRYPSDIAVEKIYDFSNNILILMPFTSSGQGRTSTAFDYLVNRTTVGLRLAMNARTHHYDGKTIKTGNDSQCAFESYQPLIATIDGRPWVQVGTPIEIMVSKTDVNGDYIIDPETGEIEKEAVQTYVMTRTLSGIQALTDVIEAKGAR